MLENNNICLIARAVNQETKIHKSLLGQARGYLARCPLFESGQPYALEKAREFQKNIYFCFIDYSKAFDCVDHSKLWQVLKEMEVPDHLIYLLRNLYVGQEATVRTGYGTTDWFKIGNGV